MATTTSPFDLTQAIQQWREGLNASPAFRPENLDELESHLRDSIANLTQPGLAVDEAFFIATRRVGGGTALGAEFGKINPRGVWLNRALWMLVGTQVFGFMRSSVYAITEGTTALGIKPVLLLGNTSSAQLYAGLLSGLVHLLAFAVALLIGWRFFTRKCNGISAWLRNKPTQSSRSAAIVAAFLIPPLLTTALQILYHRLIPASTEQPFIVGLGYGTAFAKIIESFVLILLTLLLARRQLLARI
jgi:hypothetical protein